MHRRRFLQTLGLAATAAHLRAPRLSAAPSLLKPKRLAAGSTVAMISPASATFQSMDVQIAKESLEALGLTVRLGEHMMERHVIWAETTRRAPRTSTRCSRTGKWPRFIRFEAGGAAAASSLISTSM
jgi:hypothetical protein